MIAFNDIVRVLITSKHKRMQSLFLSTKIYIRLEHISNV